MHPIRRERLFEANPSLDRGVVRDVDSADVALIRVQLQHRLGVDINDPFGFGRALKARWRSMQVPNAETEAFRLADSFSTAGVTPRRSVYINWGRFDALTMVDLSVLSAHFDDFWYPKADDLDIFDASLGWIVSIDHDGFVYQTTLA